MKKKPKNKRKKKGKKKLQLICIKKSKAMKKMNINALWKNVQNAIWKVNPKIYV